MLRRPKQKNKEVMKTKRSGLFVASPPQRAAFLIKEVGRALPSCRYAAIIALTLLLTINFQLSTLRAQGTAFTYQGRLTDNGAPANGNYDFEFVLFSTNQFGFPVGPVPSTNTVVTDGLFTVSLDFGGIFTGTNYWLDIFVRTNGAASFTELTPRQPIMPAPYAVLAESLISGGLTAGNYTNALTLNNAANSFTGRFTGDGGGVANVNAMTLGGLSSSNFWHTTGNAGTSNAFIGTTDNQPLILKVNSQPAARFEPTTDTPNVIGGWKGNFVQPGLPGVTIGGGGTIIGNQPNAVTNNGFYATIAGGYSNTVTNYGGSILGGSGNFIGGYFGTIGGGQFNAALGEYSGMGSGYGNRVDGPHSWVGGGLSNNATGGTGGLAVVAGGILNSATGNGAAIGGGANNVAGGPGAALSGGQFNEALGYFSAIGGGYANTNLSQDSAIGGGSYNNVTGDFGTVAGGTSNTVSAAYATVGGGDANTASGLRATVSGGLKNIASGDLATECGGYANVASGDHSFAAGTGARAKDNGSFVWCDVSTNCAGNFLLFYSTVANGFFARCTGGAQFVTAIDGSDNDTAGVRVAAGGTSWTTVCDRRSKKDFAPVNYEAVLDKLALVPIEQWHYQWESSSNTPNLGPMAQDFKAAFYPGRDDKSISTLEFDGVELAAIQGLNQRLNEKDARISALEKELSELKRAVKRLSDKKE